MRLNSATMFVASLMMDDDEFRKAMNEWKEDIDKAMNEWKEDIDKAMKDEDTDEDDLHKS